MTHDELLDKIYWHWINADDSEFYGLGGYRKALRAIVELHFPDQDGCSECHGFMDRDIEGWKISYPCPTIQAIEKEFL